MQQFTWLRRLTLSVALLVTTVVFVPAAQATTPTPMKVPGNPTCPSGTATSVKFESPSVGSQTQAGISLTLSDKKTVSGFDLTGTDPFNVTVIVKGGPNANLYRFTRVNSVTGVKLVSPLNSGGNVPDISHVQFCLKPGEKQPPPPCPEGTNRHPGSNECVPDQPKPIGYDCAGEPVYPGGTPSVCPGKSYDCAGKEVPPGTAPSVCPGPPGPQGPAGPTTTVVVVNKCDCKPKAKKKCPPAKAKKKCPRVKYIKYKLVCPSVVGPSPWARVTCRVKGATSYLEKVDFSVNGVKKRTDWRGPFTYTTLAKHFRGKEQAYGNKRITAKLYIKCGGRRLVKSVSFNLDPPV